MKQDYKKSIEDIDKNFELRKKEILQSRKVEIE